MVPVTRPELNRRLDARVKQAAELAAKDWWYRQCRDLSMVMHLWIKPGTMAFYIGPEGLNEEWIKVEEVSVNIAMGVETVTWMIIRVAEYLPLYDASVK